MHTTRGGTVTRERMFIKQASTSRSKCRGCRGSIEKGATVLAIAAPVTGQGHCVLRYLHAAPGKERCLRGVREMLMENSRELPGLKGVLALGAAVSGTIVGSGGG